MLRKAIHLLLALALVVTTTGLTGRVLCVGGDGHREIEAQDAACCGAKALGPLGDGPALDARCAGKCVDTPLSLSALHSKSAYVAPVLAPAALAAPANGIASAWQASLSPPRRVAASPPPRALGTTVRLC
jgi:hypothetical protein